MVNKSTKTMVPHTPTDQPGTGTERAVRAALSRYRVNKIKRMHSIVEGVLPLLEEVAAHPDIAQVTPGRINPKRRGKDRRLTFQYFTDSGFKLMAHTSQAVQEVFVVTAEPQKVVQQLSERDLIVLR